MGDQGVRMVQTGPSQRVADGHSGFAVFMNVAAGNGTFVTAAGAANTGSGVIDPGSVPNPAAWTPGTYTIAFTAPGAWQVTDASNAVVASGTYSPGDTIAFGGVQVRLTGQPAANDTFTVSTAGRTDAFAAIQAIIDALGQPQSNDASRAQFATAMAAAIKQVDVNIGHFGTVRAEVGARLSALEQSENARADYETALQKTLSQVQDLDYATALTKMNQQMTALQATQQSYSKIAQLSLFNYL
jgi:flagellar hook-associated protein 3 FlgL